MKNKLDLIRQYCLIQMQVIADREERLRREVQDCKLQREYLTQLLIELDSDESLEEKK
jgi:hypothetical protein